MGDKAANLLQEKKENQDKDKDKQ